MIFEKLKKGKNAKLEEIQKISMLQKACLMFNNVQSADMYFFGYNANVRCKKSIWQM